MKINRVRLKKYTPELSGATIGEASSKSDWGNIEPGYEWDADTGAYKFTYNYTGS
jgi:hypothetical protein